MSEIKVSGLSHVYSADTPFEKIAIDNVNVEIPHGQLVGLIGHTGSGKSTFIQHLNGLLVPSSGTVLVDSVNINGDKAAARDVRFKVGLVFQYPEYQLLEETVYADIAFGPKNMKLTESEIDERVREAAALVGVGEELFERSPLELSGGQKRRVAIAGVIAMRPGVLILAEPPAGLDPAGGRRLLDRRTGFNHGSIRCDGTPEEVFSNPKELSDIGLSVPAPTQIASALREQGVEIEGSVYTTEQLLAALLKLKKEVGRNA